MDEEKKSVRYFMENMTQEEFSEIYRRNSRSNDFETGWTRDDRYMFNKIIHNHIQKLEQENAEKDSQVY